MRREAPQQARGNDIEAIDSKLRSVAALRRAAREAGGPPPPIEVVDALLDARLRARRGHELPQSSPPQAAA